MFKVIAGRDLNCPSCGTASSNILDRRYLATTLRRCPRCALMYRAPTSTPSESKHYYSQKYRKGFTTEMPDPLSLKQLIARGFKGTDRDYSANVSLLSVLGGKPGDVLVDFGCSWGYGSYQFKSAGYNVLAFEVSMPRALYAREKLGIEICELEHTPSAKADIFFTSHVLEHVPSIHEVFKLARTVCRPGALFVAITPNGSAALRALFPKAWKTLWGLDHCNLLDDCFYRRAFADQGFIITSTPVLANELEKWKASPASKTVCNLDGWELLIATHF